MSAVVSPERTSTDTAPAFCATAMSVYSLSPTAQMRSLGMPVMAEMTSIMLRLGLPMYVGSLPEDAVRSAQMLPQSGRTSSAGMGQTQSGFAAMNAAPRRRKWHARSSFSYTSSVSKPCTTTSTVSASVCPASSLTRLMP